MQGRIRSYPGLEKVICTGKSETFVYLMQTDPFYFITPTNLEFMANLTPIKSTQIARRLNITLSTFIS